MSELTIEELFEVLADAAGETDAEIVPAESLDTPFTDIGYDSLALIETAARIAERTGAKVDDDRLLGAQTPRELLELLNRAGAVQP